MLRRCESHQLYGKALTKDNNEHRLIHIFCRSFNPLQNLAMSSSPLRGGQSRCSKVTSTPPGDTTFSSFKLFLKPGSLPRLSKANVSYDEVSIGQNGSPLAVIQTVALRGCPRTDVFSDIAYEVRMILKHAYHKLRYSYSIMVLARGYSNGRTLLPLV